MSKKANPKLIGAFVLGAVGLLVAGLMIFGSGKFFQKKYIYVLYFPGSVKGLNVGAPVILKGVKIGTVTDISVIFNPRDITFHTPVYIEIFPESVKTAVGKDIADELAEIAGDHQKSMKLLVDRGLRARLELQSIVTGQLLVALDVYPDAPVTYVGLDKEVDEIPTLPTSLQEISKTIENLPIKEIAENMQKAIAGVNKLVNTPELAESIRSLNQTLEDFGKLARKVDDQVAPVSSSIEETMRDTQKLVRNADSQIIPLSSGIKEASEAARSALEQTEKTLATIQDATGRNSTLREALGETLQELSAAARALRVLTDYLERHPDALIRGKGGPGGK